MLQQDPNKQLIPFLRNLADRIENNELPPEQIQKIGKFFLTYSYEEELNSNIEMKDDFSQEEMVKFCSLGWYVYCVLLKDKITVSSDEEE